MKATRLDRCKILKSRLADGRHLDVIWSDEKLFTIEESINKQNHRILALTASDANSSGRIVSRSQHPQRVMVWGAISSKGKSPLVFIDPDVKISADVYRKTVLEDTLLPWARSHYGDDGWIFQQDSAPAHKAKSTQEWLRAHVPDFMTPSEWPPCSPISTRWILPYGGFYRTKSELTPTEVWIL
ncbi:hypothetical protein Y032_0531g3034 [Ancylostoma ceylanicum]|uniref:Tc1-like transposase DDE domain-containing protein n=1 Tax=Ancylostoma ceylanicum TaxID=53326 RepID=A0A016WT93_9BILA|nr:hypothetical protein Y032_0531g3034 [Ancylostoma ceylanicum]